MGQENSCLQDVEVGPIWNQAHAVEVAAGYIKNHPEYEWTGQWKTTRPGEMSTVQIQRKEIIDAEEISYVDWEKQGKQMPTEQANSFLQDVEVGPIWNQAHAAEVAAEYIKNHPEYEWTGHWNTTKQGEMSTIKIKRIKGIHVNLDSTGNPIVDASCAQPGNFNFGATQSAFYMLPINNQETPNIKITSFHVSNKSSSFENNINYIGFVLYRFEDKSEWELNGVHFKSGYIFIVDSSLLDPSAVETMHAQAYYKLCNVYPQPDILAASGFAFKDGDWRETSGTFNKIPSVYKRQLERTGVSEMEYVKRAIINWASGGGQNYFRNMPLTIMT